jgi:hypothetical protein
MIFAMRSVSSILIVIVQIMGDDYIKLKYMTGVYNEVI